MDGHGNTEDRTIWGTSEHSDAWNNAPLAKSQGNLPLDGHGHYALGMPAWDSPAESVNDVTSSAADSVSDDASDVCNGFLDFLGGIFGF
jgi:hypothetical protein